MKNFNRTLRLINIVLGILSILLIIFNFVVFSRLRPKMVAFEPLVGIENSLMTIVGFGLLLILGYYLLSMLQIAKYFQHTSKIDPMSLLLLIATVLSLLFVFSDVALLSDINKQYLHQFDQPEWTLVYPILVFQLFISIILLIFHFSGRFIKKSVESVGRDINIFLVIQYVGLICGSMGLAAGFLGFLFPNGYSLSIHSVLTSIILLLPYALAIGYWGLSKLKEKNRQWIDEKQQRDIGRSALMSLLVMTIFMIFLFVINFRNLDGVVRNLWLPLNLFGTIFVFSLGNLIYSAKA